MRKIGSFSLVIILLTGFLWSCGQGTKEVPVTPVVPAAVSTATEDVKDRSFDELFTTIQPEDIPESVFKLVGSDYTVITAGNESTINSMVASYGGWGILFEKPVTWCFLRANRYTLEKMREENTYTMSYFEDIHKGEFMKFGTQSGRNTDKMKETRLTPVVTPEDNMSYKEAKLIIECEIVEITTVSPDDFATEHGREFVIGGYEEAKDYHKLVFGEIKKVWIRK